MVMLFGFFHVDKSTGRVKRENGSNRNGKFAKKAALDKHNVTQSFPRGSAEFS